MAIQVKMRQRGLQRCVFSMPQGSRPAGQGFGQSLVSILLRKPEEKAFGVTITVGVRPTCQQSKPSSRVAAYLPEPVESHRREKQESQQEASLRGKELVWWGLRHTRDLLLHGQGFFQLRKQGGFVRGC